MRSLLPSLLFAAAMAAAACVRGGGAPAMCMRAAPAAAPSSDDAAVERAEQDYLDLVVAISPEHATALGLHARDAELDDRSIAGWTKNLEREESMLRALEVRFHDTSRLSHASRTDLAILEHTLAVDVYWQRSRRPLETQPDVYAAPLDAIYTMMARDYAPAKERARDVLARLRKIPGVVALAKSNLEHPPRIWTDVAIEKADGAKVFFADLRGELLAALTGEPDAERDVDAAMTPAAAAYAAYAESLKRDVLPRSTGDFAAGRQAFEFLLRENYFLADDLVTIEALGKRVLQETGAAMDALARSIDPAARGWPEVTSRLKRDHPSAADLRPSYEREVARARAFLVDKDIVPFPEGDACEVRDTPPVQRSTITAAYDEAPPFDHDPHGFFFVTPVDTSATPEAQEEALRENDHGDEVDTAVHETYPGHHLQLSFARRHPSRIRKATAPDIFEEGWALYAEELMNELGYYTKEERMMQLEWTLVRAARVLIDIGLHTQGMTFDAAVALLMNDAHLERELAVSEVKRYTLEPTQPLAYLVGREKIVELRRRYQEREGAAYTLKRFHAEVLSHGSIAPSLLADEMFDTDATQGASTRR